MIPYQLDPSLHPAQPASPQLDDGFSPPAPMPPPEPAQDAPKELPVLPAKSDF